MSFAKENLGRYFRYCLQGLSHHYTGFDTSRLTGIYFAILGLDLINELETVNKQQIVDYIYAMQVKCLLPEFSGQSGFIGSPYLGQPFSVDGIIYSEIYPCECQRIYYMQGHIAMTYSALSALTALGDDLSRVNRRAIVSGLQTLQQSNGSYRSTFSLGECDMRFVYCACAISSLLNDWNGVNQEQALQYIRSCITYEGGISLIPGSEAHGGSTYCALASLSLMGRLGTDSSCLDRDYLTVQERDLILNWCLKRQSSTGGGYNGRCNKECDSCYSFWIGASIDLLGSFHLTDIAATRKALLELYQNSLLGGFSKLPSAPVDILHSFYSLAWLSISKEEGTNVMNSAYCLRNDRLKQK